LGGKEAAERRSILLSDKSRCVKLRDLSDSDGTSSSLFDFKLKTRSHGLNGSNTSEEVDSREQLRREREDTWNRPEKT
jgi:hypothetical protein